jgi:hypothetical protein
MALDPNQDRRTQIAAMLSSCEDFRDKLSNWEKKFLDSVTATFEETGRLSDPQVNKLEEIHIKLP